MAVSLNAQATEDEVPCPAVIRSAGQLSKAQRHLQLEASHGAAGE